MPNDLAQSERQVRRISRELTPEERARLSRYREQVEGELPNLRERARAVEAQMRAEALAEPTISGQLRRAIVDSGLSIQSLAAEANVSPKTVADFLVGVQALDSLVVDKLAHALHQELRPIRSN